MGQFSLPIHVSCVRSTIRSNSKDSSPGVSTPTISVGLNLDIPIGNLLSVLMTYQQSSQTPEANMPTPNFKGLQKPVDPPKSASAQEPLPPTGEHRVVESPSAAPSVPSVAATGTWEPMAALRNPNCRRVKVYNLMKSVRPRDVKFVFEKHVGPIDGECSINDCVGTLHFTSAEHAHLAVEKYNGGILEVSSDKRTRDDEHVSLKAAPWGLDGPALQRRMEELLWPFEDSQLRRGEGWLTLFRVSKAKEAKRTEQPESHQVDFKGSILTVKLDDPVPDQEGIVIQGAAMIL